MFESFYFKLSWLIAFLENALQIGKLPWLREARTGNHSQRHLIDSVPGSNEENPDLSRIMVEKNLKLRSGCRDLRQEHYRAVLDIGPLLWLGRLLEPLWGQVPA